jgi:hypothetical protein
MKKGKLIGRTFGIALVLAMIGAMLPLSGFVFQNRALAQGVATPSSLELLGAGARWASQTCGGTALYVNWQDNLFLHPTPEYEDPIPTEPNLGDSISYILETYGFDVEFAGDIPADLSGYSVVVITAYWAVEPANEPVIRNYISDGGGVVLTESVPCYFVTCCKDYWPGIGSLAPIQDWFGASWHTNTGGYAEVTIDNPFGTSLMEGDVLVEGGGYSYAAILQLRPGAEIMAEWGTGHIFSFAYETTGRLYYQSFCEELDTIPALDIGDTVKVIDRGESGLNIHGDSPTGDVISVVPDGWTFEIIGGPQYDILGHDWWEVRDSQYENEPLVEGWVEEDYLKEVSSGTLIPDSAPEYFNSASTQVEAAIAWAENQEWNPSWSGLCLRFVSQAYGYLPRRRRGNSCLWYSQDTDSGRDWRD